MNQKLKSLILIGIFALSGAVHAATQMPKRSDDDVLTWEFAKFRKAQVKDVSYELSFTFDKESDDYKGTAIITAELNRTDAPLSLDFSTKQITSLKVNGVAVTDYAKRTGSFDIPAKYLAKNVKIEVVYVNAFDKDGEGVTRSVDPEDSSEYLFTDFEPYRAHRLFPSFDQPDLRATYSVTVDAPKGWKVIANDLVASEKTTGDRTVTVFNKTKPFSTYLFFVGAGNFVEWKENADGVPMVLYARKSLAKYVDAKNIFATSRKGLKFFSEYFGYPYPFPKFGMIYIPEFASGGMENPGAISLVETAIFRGPVPQSRIDSRDSLILHEMAHMWFGDLVTMAWWNDLWLNESFATYAASLAQFNALGTKGTWLDFYNDKGWGYWQDQLVTTHPIETPVRDTQEGKGNFDGITYSKGGAALKQLHYFVGDEGFRKGLQSYFQKYAWKNTVRPDFIAEIATASGQKLDTWTKTWLQTAGPNRTQAKWTCKDGKVNAFSLEQQKSSSGTLSPHRTEIALFKVAADGTFNLLKTQPASYSTASTKVPELVGADCPDFVYANYGDQDYALYSLDPISLKVARQALTGGAKDPLLRLMIWNTLAQMVRDSQLAVSEYFDMVLAGLTKEADDDLLGIILSRWGYPSRYYQSYLTKDQRKALAPQLEAIVWQRTKDQESGSSSQMVLFDFYSSIVQTPEGLARLADTLQGKQVPKGLKMDQPRRWSIISTLASHGYKGSSELIAAEEKTDNTTDGKRYAYAARAAIPTTETKRKFWQDMQKPDQLPFSTLRMAANRFNDSNHVELSESFTKDFFSTVQKIDWAANENLIDIYFDGLFPYNICTKKLLSESQSQMKRAKNLVPLAKRAWLETNDELSKCISVRAFEKKGAG